MGDHNQLDGKLVASQLNMKWLPGKADWVHDIRLGGDQGANCCSYIGIRSDDGTCYSSVLARNLEKQTCCAALVMGSTSESRYSNIAHHLSVVARPGYY